MTAIIFVNTVTESFFSLKLSKLKVVDSIYFHFLFSFSFSFDLFFIFLFLELRVRVRVMRSC